MDSANRIYFYGLAKKLGIVKGVKIFEESSVYNNNSNPMGYNCTPLSLKEFRRGIESKMNYDKLPFGMSVESYFNEFNNHYLEIIKNYKRRSAIIFPDNLSD